MKNEIFSLSPVTEEVMKRFSLNNDREINDKIDIARKAFKKWKEIEVEKRVKFLKKVSRLLKKNKEKYALLITREMGKPLKESRGEIEKCVWLCEYYAKNATKFLKKDIIKTDAKKSYVRFDSLGLILGIMPWNFPFWQVFRFAIPVLCAGNCCILKHSSNVPQCALEIEKIFREAGFMKGVFTTLLCDSRIIEKIINEDKVDGISLTGSVEAGVKVAEIAGKNIKKVVLELGGSDPFIVLRDADLKFTCERAVSARLRNAGQSCIAAKRFIVVKDKMEEFKEKILEYVKKLKVGNPLDEETDIGPLARKDLVNKIEEQVKDALKKGGKILYGGHSVGKKGYYYKPTIITNVNKRMKILKEETFGPLFVLIPVNNENEAIKIANNSKFGLGASIWTKDIKKAERLAGKIEAGNVFVNNNVHSDPRLPFGGIKKSGFGRELGSYGIKEFVNIKTVFIG